MNEVQKIKRSSNLNLTIYHLFKEGKRPQQICKILGISQSNLAYYTSTLKQERIIRKIGYGVWEVLKDFSDSDFKKEFQKRSSKKSSLGTRPITNLHALQINFPIVEGVVKDSDWEIKEKLNNWIPKYKRFNILGGLKIKNNNNKSITIFVKSRNIIDLNEVGNLAFKIRDFAFEFFKDKHEVILDIANTEIKNMNLATEDKQSESMMRKGEKFELDLNKKSEKILPADKINAKAWIDASPFKFSAETNDLEWKRDYLQMPFIIKGLANSLPAIKEYTHQIKLHMKVQEEQLRTQKETQDILKEIKDFFKN